MTVRVLLVIATILAGLAVALGAFGAHGLRSIVTPERVETFETAVRYHMWHALALIALGILASVFPDLKWTLPAWLFLIGILVFSGSLYILVLTDTSWLGAITPIGGTLIIAGWGFLALQLWRM
ncbi:MAG: DUF423 domain-containing protein [Bacteroidota bacterium]